MENYTYLNGVFYFGHWKSEECDLYDPTLVTAKGKKYGFTYINKNGFSSRSKSYLTRAIIEDIGFTDFIKKALVYLSSIEDDELSFEHYRHVVCMLEEFLEFISKLFMFEVSLQFIEESPYITFNIWYNFISDEKRVFGVRTIRSDTSDEPHIPAEIAHRVELAKQVIDGRDKQMDKKPSFFEKFFGFMSDIVGYSKADILLKQFREQEKADAQFVIETSAQLADHLRKWTPLPLFFDMIDLDRYVIEKSVN